MACPPPRHLLSVSGVPWCLTLDPSGWGWSLCQRLLFAPCSRLRFLSWWSSLWLRVFRVVGSLPCSSLTVGRFLGHLHCTSSCPQVVFCAWICLLLVGLRPLPDVSLCALWLPARLLWPSLRPRVCEGSSLSNWLFPFRGSSPISRLFLSLGPCRSRSPFHPSLLLGGVLVRLCGGPKWRSLAMSWACPSPFLCVGLVCRSRSHCRATSLLTVSSFASGSSWGGASPHALGSVGAHGVSGGFTYIALHRSWSVSVIWPYTHWSSGRCFILLACCSACILVSLTGLYVSQPQHSHRVVFIGHLRCRVTGLTYCPPPRTSRTLSIALTYRQASLVLMHPAIDIQWRWPCLPRLRLLWPLAIAVRLVVFTSWLAP